MIISIRKLILSIMVSVYAGNPLSSYGLKARQHIVAFSNLQSDVEFGNTKTNPRFNLLYKSQ